MPNASHIRTNRAAFSADGESRQPPSRSGLLAMTPTVRPPNRPSAVTMLGAQRCVQLEHRVLVEQVATNGCTSYARFLDSGICAARSTSSTSSSVEGPLVAEQRDQPAGLAEGVRLGVGQHVHDAGTPAVRLGSAEPQHVDVLAGDGPDHVGTGHEDAALRPEDHHVGQSRTVGRTAGGRAEHHRDLRDLARRLRHRVEDQPDSVQRQHALGQPRAAGVPQPDDRRPVGHRPLVRPTTTLQPSLPIAPPMTVASEQKATVWVPSTVPTAASMPQSSSSLISSSEPWSKNAASRLLRVARVLLARQLRPASAAADWRSVAASVCRHELRSARSRAAEGDGDVVAAEAEGVVERRDVAVGQRARLGGDVELDRRVQVVEVDRRWYDAVYSASTVATDSSAPAPPSRWPVIDLVE